MASADTTTPTEAVVEAAKTSPEEVLLRARDEVRAGESLASQSEIYADEFNARLLAEPGCRNCGGSGYIGRGVMAPICPCTQLNNYRRAAEMRINKLFGKGDRQMTFASFDTGDFQQNEIARRVARNFVENWRQAREEGWILGFQGDPGTGKTHLVTAMAIALVKRHFIYPAVLNVPRMFFLERQRFGEEKDSGPSQIELAQVADLTVLDDIGAEYHRDRESEQVTWVQEMLYLVLEERIRRGLPTLYTTNLPRAALQQHFGSGTVGARLWGRIERAEVMPALELRPVPEKRQKNTQARDMLLGR